jgi:two-component system OmpR family sensor kinase
MTDTKIPTETRTPSKTTSPTRVTQTTDSVTAAERHRWTIPIRIKAARLRVAMSSFRAHLLARYFVLLSIAAVASVLLVRQIVINGFEERIQRGLEQEVEELRAFSRSTDPRTGRPYGDRIGRMFHAFLRGDIPELGEASITFVDGQPFERSRQVVPYRLDHDPELVDRWGSLTEPERGRVETPAGPVEYLGVPLETDSGIAGVFVIAIFRDVEESEVDEVTLGAAGVGLIVLIIGSVLAWRVARRTMEPVEEVTRTAQSISESDLLKRIEVGGQEGQDEISRLAQTFNDMLDRLQTSFTAQRAFINDAGHELRTPIQILTGQLEVLEDDPEERRRTVSLLLDELDRMARMVNDLLVLAKAEQPDFLRLETVHVATLTDELASKIRTLGERDWRVDEVGQGVIVADRQRLTQAVMQLAQNAVQHTPKGAEAALGSEVNEASARLWIRDAGPGIAPERHERIFARFSRGEASSRSDGAGLGLAIVKAIVQAHGGRVTLESRLGHGSTFAIEVPLDPPAAKEPSIVR